MSTETPVAAAAQPAAEASEPKTVDVFANDPVAPEQTLSEQQAAGKDMATATADEPSSKPTVEAFANDPVSPDTSAPAEDKSAAEPVAEPVTHGVLGYKAPGLLSHLRFSSRYFWLGDEAIPASDLKQYLQSEKSTDASHTAAWSSQTGKGLLYFVKREEDKKTPAGVINLSEISELAKGANNDFSFKLNGKEHAFQASTAAIRDGWYSSVESASHHAVGLKEDMVSSSGYKETLSTLAVPGAIAAGAVVAAGATGAVAANESSKKDTEGLSESAAESKSKDRSVSRNKRNSIFGGILGKKDDTPEKPAEEKPAEEKQAEATDAKVEASKEAEKADAEKEAAAVAAKKEDAKKEELKKEKAAKEQAEKDKKAQEKKAAAAKKEQDKKEKAAKEQAEKEKKAADKKAAEAKKEQERKEKEQQKALAKAKKDAEDKEAATAKAQKEAADKEAATKEAEAKAEEKKAEAAEAEDKKKDLEAAGAGVGAAAVAGAGVAAVAASHDDTDKPATEPLADKTNTESPAATTETTKTTKSTKRNSIFGLFQKSSTPATEIKSEDGAPAVPPKDAARNLPVADKTDAAATTEPAASDAAVNGSAVNGSAVNGSAVNGSAVNGSAVNGDHKPATTEAAKTEPATSEKRLSSFFGFGGAKKEKESKTEPATNGEAVAPAAAAATVPAAAAATDGTSEATPAAPATAAKQKQPSKLSEFIRRPSQLIKSKQSAAKDKTNSTAPATVAEAEGKDDGAKVNGATGIDEKTEEVLETAKVEPVAGEGETTAKNDQVIGDVVPEAVSVGNAQDASSIQPPTAPVVTASA